MRRAPPTRTHELARSERKTRVVVAAIPPASGSGTNVLCQVECYPPNRDGARLLSISVESARIVSTAAGSDATDKIIAVEVVDPDIETSAQLVLCTSTFVARDVIEGLRGIPPEFGRATDAMLADVGRRRGLIADVAGGFQLLADVGGRDRRARTQALHDHDSPSHCPPSYAPPDRVLYQGDFWSFKRALRSVLETDPETATGPGPGPALTIERAKRMIMHLWLRDAQRICAAPTPTEVDGKRALWKVGELEGMAAPDVALDTAQPHPNPNTVTSANDQVKFAIVTEEPGAPTPVYVEPGAPGSASEVYNDPTYTEHEHSCVLRHGLYDTGDLARELETALNGADASQAFVVELNPNTGGIEVTRTDGVAFKFLMSGLANSAGDVLGFTTDADSVGGKVIGSALISGPPSYGVPLGFGEEWFHEGDGDNLIIRFAEGAEPHTLTRAETGRYAEKVTNSRAPESFHVSNWNGAWGAPPPWYYWQDEDTGSLFAVLPCVERTAGDTSTFKTYWCFGAYLPTAPGVVAYTDQTIDDLLSLLMPIKISSEIIHGEETTRGMLVEDGGRRFVDIGDYESPVDYAVRVALPRDWDADLASYMWPGFALKPFQWNEQTRSYAYDWEPWGYEDAGGTWRTIDPFGAPELSAAEFDDMCDRVVSDEMAQALVAAQPQPEPLVQPEPLSWGSVVRRLQSQEGFQGMSESAVRSMCRYVWAFEHTDDPAPAWAAVDSAIDLVNAAVAAANTRIRQSDASARAIGESIAYQRAQKKGKEQLVRPDDRIAARKLAAMAYRSDGNWSCSSFPLRPRRRGDAPSRTVLVVRDATASTFREDDSVEGDGEGESRAVVLHVVYEFEA